MKCLTLPEGVGKGQGNVYYRLWLPGRISIWAGWTVGGGRGRGRKNSKGKERENRLMGSMNLGSIKEMEFGLWRCAHSSREARGLILYTLINTECCSNPLCGFGNPWTLFCKWYWGLLTGFNQKMWSDVYFRKITKKWYIGLGKKPKKMKSEVIAIVQTRIIKSYFRALE